VITPSSEFADNESKYGFGVKLSHGDVSCY
jgi:hypothetical protein